MPPPHTPRVAFFPPPSLPCAVLAGRLLYLPDATIRAAQIISDNLPFCRCPPIVASFKSPTPASPFSLSCQCSRSSVSLLIASGHSSLTGAVTITVCVPALQTACDKVRQGDAPSGSPLIIDNGPTRRPICACLLHLSAQHPAAHSLRGTARPSLLSTGNATPAHCWADPLGYSAGVPAPPDGHTRRLGALTGQWGPPSEPRDPTSYLRPPCRPPTTSLGAISGGWPGCDAGPRPPSITLLRPAPRGANPHPCMVRSSHATQD